MSDSSSNPDQAFDLDEDLFDFGELADRGELAEEEEQDLEAIFAAFQQQAEELEEEPPAEPASRATEGEASPTPAPQPVGPAPAPAPTPAAPSAGPEPPPVRPAPTSDAVAASPTVQLVPVAAGVSRSALLILVSATLLNGLVAFVSLQSVSAMRDTVRQAANDLSRAADRIHDDAVEQARELGALRLPLVPPDAEDHPTFARASELIREGRFAEARTRIYALLAVVDRLEAGEREEVEARAHFLLAEATHMEALSRYEEERR